MADGVAYEVVLTSPAQVVQLVRQNLAARQPFSLARMGTAEIAVLFHTLNPKAWPMQPYVVYSGVSQFTRQTAQRLRAALQGADLLGLLPPENPFAGSAERALQAHGITPRRTCDAFIPRDLAAYPPFLELLATYRVIVIGRRAAESLPALARHGIVPVATYNLEGLRALNRTLTAVAKGPDFDLALLAAGVPATIAAVELARTLGKVALDFGHGLDIIIEGETFDYQNLERSWWRRHRARQLRRQRVSRTVRRRARIHRRARVRRGTRTQRNK